MKIKISHFLGILCLGAIVVLTGCTDTGYSFSDNQMCYKNTQGNQTCMPLSTTQWVLVSRENDNITMSARDAEALSRLDLGGISVTKEQFIANLRRSAYIYEFDPNNFKIDWSGDKLTFVHQSDPRLNSEPFRLTSQESLLMMRDESSNILVAAYGATPCTDVHNVSDSIRVKDRNNDGIGKMQFTICSTTMNGFIAEEDGGPIILIIDPAVIDPMALVSRYNRWLDPRVIERAISRGRAEHPLAFLNWKNQGGSIEKLNTRSVQPMDFTPIGDSKPLDCSNPPKDTDTLCSFADLVSIEECGGVFHFSRNGAQIDTTLDNHLCPLTVVLDSIKKRTYILTNPNCKGVFWSEQ
ncbi:MAG: hypothetical protein U0176_02780 [Bacteroidia bacterium]